jgi:hypothetical protein
MRAISTIILRAVSALSAAFLVGYVRTILELMPIRPDPGWHIVFEPKVVAYYDYESSTPGGFQFEPFFPPAFDLPEDSAQVFSLPCWIVASLSASILMCTCVCLIGQWRRNK